MSGFIAILALICLPLLGLLLRPLLAADVSTPASAAAQLNLAVLRDQLRELEQDHAQGSIDAPAYQAARAELEQRVAQEVSPAMAQQAGASGPLRWQAGVLALLLVVAAGLLYAQLGNPQALQQQQAAMPAQGAAHAAETPAAMVEQLAARLEGAPQDAEGWALLARSYSAMGRFAAASAAYARLVTLVPDDAQILADYADVLAMTQNQRVSGEPERLLQRALALDPQLPKALILAGDGAYEQQNLQAAADYWRRALAAARPGSEFAQMASDNLAHIGAGNSTRAGTDAESGAAVAAPAPPAAKVATLASAASDRTISGTLVLDTALRAQVAPDDTVFIVAKAVDGPRFPLAVLRKQVRDLPLQFRLDDSMGMMPGVKLSQFAQVQVSARLTRSGNAMAAPGDVQSAVLLVPPGASGLQLQIRPISQP